MNKAFFIFALCFVSTFASETAKTPDFTFYIFASEWAGTVCQQQTCIYDQGAVSNFWNILGLWPSDGKQDVIYCPGPKYYPNILSGLGPELVQYWSGLYSSADALYAHEWAEHGTCTGMDQLDFFSLVLQLAKIIDLYSALTKHGITPGGTYQCSDFATAINAEYGVKGFILASQSGEINTIELCLGKNLQVQECPSEIVSICSGSVTYPKFSPKGSTAQIYA